jgi:hypothetical protein
MKKLVVVLAVAFSGVLNAQDIVNNFVLNESFNTLTIASKNNIALSYDSLITNDSELFVDSLIDVKYEPALNSKYSITVNYIDNGVVSVAVLNNEAYRPENFDQTARNNSFYTTLNNIELAFLKGVLLDEIEIVFSKLEK